MLLFSSPLWAQEQAGAVDAQVSLVGLRLAEVIERFGAPKAVFAARGNELWQDDVVFQYEAGDFYIFRDRVWQVRLASARGVSAGDPKQAALLVLGDKAQDRGDHLLLPISAGALPLMFRVNLNAGVVSAIFIYRSDF